MFFGSIQGLLNLQIILNLKFAENIFFELHDFYLAKNQNVLREEFIFTALMMYYPDLFMGFKLNNNKMNICSFFGAGPLFVSNPNICELSNSLYHVVKEKQTFIMRKEVDLVNWL